MISSALCLAFLGFISFLLAPLLTLGGLNALADTFSTTGSFCLLAAFALIFFSGAFLLIRQTALLLAGYFSATARAQRKILFHTNQLANQHSIFASKKAKLQYKYRQKRKLLSGKTD